MVTLVVLSAGIVAVYKTFFLCTDYLTRLSMRLQAHELLDEKIADLSRQLRRNGNASFSYGPMTVNKEVNRKIVDFTYQIQMAPVPGFDGLFRLQGGISWPDAGRTDRFERAALLSV